MSRYMDLTVDLNRTLEERRKLCRVGDRYGLIPREGREEEWQRLTERAEEIRKEMWRIRYG